MNMNSITKNSTRISSLMGVWTGLADFKTDIGSNELEAYFVIYFTCNPMKEYACVLDGCSEIDNEMCQKPITNVKHTANRCSRMEDIVADWSDVSAFIFLGGSAKVGFPFNVHVRMDTGGFLGPYNIVFSQNKTKIGEKTHIPSLLSSDDEPMTVIDSYVTRYVETPYTRFLRTNPDNNLFIEQEFDDYMGANAVNNTVHEQKTNPFSGPHGDPYEEYAGTCDNGNLRPILPLGEFTFYDDPDDPDRISVQVKLDYKILIFPDEGSPLQEALPELKKKGAPISGPYCYHDSPKGGYTIDMSFDSSVGSPYIELVKGCVDGIPCLPPAMNTCDAALSVEIHDKSSPSTIEVGPVLGLSISIAMLCVGILISCFINWKQQKKIIQLKTEVLISENGNHVELGVEGIDSDLSDPLIQSKMEVTSPGDNHID